MSLTWKEMRFLCVTNFAILHSINMSKGYISFVCKELCPSVDLLVGCGCLLVVFGVVEKRRSCCYVHRWWTLNFGRRDEVEYHKKKTEQQTQRHTPSTRHVEPGDTLLRSGVGCVADLASSSEGQIKRRHARRRLLLVALQVERWWQKSATRANGDSGQRRSGAARDDGTPPIPRPCATQPLTRPPSNDNQPERASTKRPDYLSLTAETAPWLLEAEADRIRWY